MQEATANRKRTQATNSSVAVMSSSSVANSAAARTKAQRGFAVMDKSRQREIASAGGRAAHARGNAHEFTADEAREAGRKGGRSVSEDKGHMANIGRKGGLERGKRHASRSNVSTSKKTAGLKAETGAFPKAEAGLKTGSFPKAEAGLKTGSFPKAEAGLKTGSFPKAEAGLKTGSFPKAEAGLKTGSFPKAEAGLKMGKAEAGLKTGVSSKAKAGLKTGSFSGRSVATA